MTQRRPTLKRQIRIGLLVTVACAQLIAIGAVYAFERPSDGVASALRRVAPLVTFAAGLSWDMPGERRKLVDAISRATGQAVELRDTRGELVEHAGPAGCESWQSARVEGRGAVSLCRATGLGIRAFAIRAAEVGLIGVFVWLLGAVLARRVTRPLEQLATAARELERGETAAALPTSGSREVDALAHTFAAMASQLQAQLRGQHDLLAMTSHELRSPIARMQVLVELAAAGVDVADSLAELGRELSGMTGLLEDLLATARIDRQAMEPRRLALDDLIRVAAGDREVVVSCPPGLTVRADATLLTRAFALLIDNAFRHAAPPVRVVCRQDGEWLELAVEDRGPGLADAELERVFEAFYHRTGSDGVGLGLHLARRIAEAHGGGLDAGNLATGGARFTMRLPA